MYRSQPKIVIVTRETRMEGLLKRWTTKGQAEFIFKKNRAVAAAQRGDLDQAVAAQRADDADFLELDREDATYHEAVQRLPREMSLGVPVQVIDRAFLPTMFFGDAVAVVVVGQDGLVANTAKYVGEVPIVGVNPDPERFDGVLLPFTIDRARAAVNRVMKGTAAIRKVTLAEATLHDGQSLLAFNDFFLGAKSHVSARYQLHWRDHSEQQSSSGILISTGAGSTGWMSSVYNMACGVARVMGHEMDPAEVPEMPWDAPYLKWAVREPFRSRTSGISLVCGDIREGETIVVESQMAGGGVIFSDGVESDFLEFNGGSIARIGVAARRAHLVV